MYQWNDVERVAGQQQQKVDLDYVFVAMSAKSLWADYFLERLSKMINIVGCFDEKLPSDSDVFGIPALTLAAIANLARSQKNIAVVDFSRIPFEIRFNKFFCEQQNIPCVDFSQILNEFDVAMMYETPSISRAQTTKYLAEYKRISGAFLDELSRQTLLGTLLFRLTFDRRYLFSVLSTPDSEYFNIFSDGDGLRIGHSETYVDVGAYRGDTVYKFLAASEFKFEHIHAFEPDTENYIQLRQARMLAPKKISLYRKAVSDTDGVATFSDTGTSGSSLSSDGNISVDTVRLDTCVNRMTILKMDVEGYEPSVLRGAMGLMREFRPKIASACYHFSGDILAIMKEIEEASVPYTYRLRHYSSYCGDTCLYAVPT